MVAPLCAEPPVDTTMRSATWLRHGVTPPSDATMRSATWRHHDAQRNLATPWCIANCRRHYAQRHLSTPLCAAPPVDATMRIATVSAAAITDQRRRHSDLDLKHRTSLTESGAVRYVNIDIAVASSSKYFTAIRHSTSRQYTRYSRKIGLNSYCCRHRTAVATAAQ